MTDYGYWEHDHTEVTEEELHERYDEMLDEIGEVNIGELRWDASVALKELDPIAYRVGLSDYHDSLLQDDEILSDEEMQEYISEAMICWADDMVLLELPDELQDQIDDDSERYHWAIGELESSGILEYVDKDMIEIHAHSTLESVVKYVEDYIKE